MFDRAYIGRCTLQLSPIVNIKHWESGLRITFELMTSLASIRKIVVHEGGIVLVGVDIALVPMRLLDSRTKSVQWHLVERKTTIGGSLSLSDHNRFWEEALSSEAKLETRLKETDVEKLRGIAYVGWSSEDVFISWDPPSFTDLRRSSLPNGSSYKFNSGSANQINLQFGVPYAGGGFATARNYGTVSTSVRSWRQGPFASQIESLYRGIVFIYDTSRHVGWLCSTIDLMVLMMRIYLQRKGYDDPITHRSRWARLDDDSIGHLRRLDLDNGAIPQDSRSTYGTLIDHFCVVYESHFDVLKKYERNRCDPILGWDLYDILNPAFGSGVDARKLAATGGIERWSSLLGKEDIIFVNGWSNLICAEERTLCPFIQEEIPPNILFCPLYLLKELLERHRCKIRETSVDNDFYEWIFTGRPYHCREQWHDLRNCWGIRLQKARAKTISFWVTGRSPPEENTTGFDPKSKQGAICFGKLPR